LGVRLLVGKSYHTKQKYGYSLPTNDPIIIALIGFGGAKR
jgi:hypothetical protein